MLATDTIYEDFCCEMDYFCLMYDGKLRMTLLADHEGGVGGDWLEVV